MSAYGKKIGKLVVKLDRKKTRYRWAQLEVELRFDIHSGDFWAQYEGNWYSDATKDGLTDQIKVAATKALADRGRCQRTPGSRRDLPRVRTRRRPLEVRTRA